MRFFFFKDELFVVEDAFFFVGDDFILSIL
jgi:hypothetical protein